MNAREIIDWIKSNGSERNVAGMRRFGINGAEPYGVPVPELRKLARTIKTDHALALELWRSGIHEARLIATMIGDRKLMTVKEMDEWVAEFDSWDICDQACGNLLRKLPFVYDRIVVYAADEREFVRRTAFSLMAALAVGDKKADDELFAGMLPLVERYSTDPRNFVRKAVNWALRGIGKRNMTLNAEALKMARKLSESADKTARWIGKDAVRELTSPKTLDFIVNHREKSLKTAAVLN